MPSNNRNPKNNQPVNPEPETASTRVVDPKTLDGAAQEDQPRQKPVGRPKSTKELKPPEEEFREPDSLHRVDAGHDLDIEDDAEDLGSEDVEVGTLPMNYYDPRLAEAIACELFLEGWGWSKIAKELSRIFPHEPKFTRERPRRFIWSAAASGQFRYVATADNQLAQDLAKRYDWKKVLFEVVNSASNDQIAFAAANSLSKMIRARYKKLDKDEIHIGFAGGRLLRSVARELSRLLDYDSENYPPRIVIHAMVAAFNERDFEADPNNFTSHFADKRGRIKFSVMPIAAPGIIETAFRKQLIDSCFMIQETFEAAEKLDIIVSSGSDWEDQHSATKKYIRKAGENDHRQIQSYKNVVDLLWQPLTIDGPIDLNNGEFQHRPNTLVDLNELPRMIKKGVSVMLVLGSCGNCKQPKGRVLDTLLAMPEGRRLITDVVTNRQNVTEALEIQSQRASASPGLPR